MVMGHIIGISGTLEANLGWLLALLSRGSATITMSMFHAVVSTDAQKAMLLAAAEKALAGPELEAFKDLMDDFRPRYGERSKLVHNLWGHSNDHPDKALWCKTSDAASLIAKFAAASEPESLSRIAAAEQLCFKCMAYSVKDLEEVALRLNGYKRRVDEFINELMQGHPALVAATSASTDAPPNTAEPQLDLHQPDQTAHQS
jgi:hypothetical protein